jgi:hypothetical protein
VRIKKEERLVAEEESATTNGEEDDRSVFVEEVLLARARALVRTKTQLSRFFLNFSPRGNLLSHLSRTLARERERERKTNEKQTQQTKRTALAFTNHPSCSSPSSLGKWYPNSSSKASSSLAISKGVFVATPRYEVFGLFCPLPRLASPYMLPLFFLYAPAKAGLPMT